MPFFSVPCSRHAGGTGLCSGSIPSQAQAPPAGKSPTAAPVLPKNAGALHVCRFHVRRFPRKPLALHVCRLTPYLLSFG